MSKIEQAKAYTGRDLETIFFRPMLNGPDANALGIRVMYNMPVPTTLSFWKRAGDILQKYSASGWNGSAAANKYQKSIALSKVKAEVGYSAEDYFTMVYELITNRADVNLDDLSGTELETAETALFKEAIAESIRATMWLGDSSRANAEGALNTFDGFLKRITTDVAADETDIASSIITLADGEINAEGLLKKLWEKASNPLKEFKSQGNLVYLVTSDIYAQYEDSLDNVALESAYLAKQNGRTGLYFRGIPVVDVQISGYIEKFPAMPQSFALLTDRRNLALAVNTSDFPGTEVRMWYNPDEMQNRQRAIFMAGCDYLLPELISIAFESASIMFTKSAVTATGGAVSAKVTKNIAMVSSVKAVGLTSADALAGAEVTLTKSSDTFSGTIAGASIAKVRFTVTYTNGDKEVIVKA